MDKIWSITDTASIAIPIITVGAFGFVMLFPMWRYGFIRFPRLRGRKRSRFAQALIRASQRF